MTTYITQEQAIELAESTTLLGCDFSDFEAAIHRTCNAAIQHYRDSLVAGVVLPEHVANAVHKGELVYTADQLRQAIALAKQATVQPFHESASHINPDYRDGWNAAVNALAKQVTRAPMFEFRECEDSQAAAPELKFTNARRAALREVKNSNPISIGHARTLEQHGLIVWLAERNRFLLSSSGASLLEKWESLAAAPDPKEGA